jgi:hypothetical protein
MAVSGGFLLAKKTAGERHCMREGGNSDQLVRLANGGRLVMAIGIATMIYFLPAARLVE